MFRSLQVRIPLIAVGVVALSLGVAVFVVFQFLLVGGERDLDRAIEAEVGRVRTRLAAETPAALGPAGDPPTAATLEEVFADMLADEGRISDTMTVARIGDEVLTTAHAGNRIEVLREEGRLPSLAAVDSSAVGTLATSEGDVRATGFALRVEGADASVVVLGSIAEARSTATTALGRIAAAAAMGLVIAGVLLFVAMRRVLRPLGTLAGAASSADLADLGQRVDIGGRGDEVAEVAREFNRMLERLQAGVDDHRQFMASVSHELRTPVTIARGHLELLVRSAETGTTEEVLDTARLVEDELGHMQRLVADLMALGRSSDEDFVLAEPVSLRDFLDELQFRVVGLGARDVVFEPVDDVTMLADRDRLAQAMLNIVVNAEVHASGHTRVLVGQAPARDGVVALRVSDDGSGVDPAIRESLFEPFVKAGEAETSTGLGLAVVDAVVRAHGGAVRLDTGASGTTVVLEIPQVDVSTQPDDSAS